MNKIAKLWIALVTAGMMLIPALSYAQTSESAVTTTISYFYSASGQMIDAEDNNGTMSSYLTRGERYNGISETFAVSNIKDITADLDSNGNVLNKYTYTAYGTQTSYSSTSNIQHPTLSINTNPFTYSDYYTDNESGNYYLNARYYDPTLGIFLISDSYNLPNRYMYVNGNPVMGIDPTGHEFVSENNFFCIHWHYTREQKDGPSTFHWGEYNHDNENANNSNNNNNNSIISHYSQNNLQISHDKQNINNTLNQKFPLSKTEEINSQNKEDSDLNAKTLEYKNVVNNFGALNIDSTYNSMKNYYKTLTEQELNNAAFYSTVNNLLNGMYYSGDTVGKFTHQNETYYLTHIKSVAGNNTMEKYNATKVNIEPITLPNTGAPLTANIVLWKLS